MKLYRSSNEQYLLDDERGRKCLLMGNMGKYSFRTPWYDDKYDVMERWKEVNFKDIPEIIIRILTNFEYLQLKANENI